MTTAFVEHVQIFTSFALLGLIWVVQVVVYPGFQRVPRDSFAAFHRRHCSAIGWIAAPLMVLELAAAIWLVAVPGRVPVPLQQVLLSVVIFAWFSTFFIQVPLHRRLAQQHNARDIARLVHSNWLRTAAWTLKALLVFLVPC